MSDKNKNFDFLAKSPNGVPSVNHVTINHYHNYPDGLKGSGGNMLLQLAMLQHAVGIGDKTQKIIPEIAEREITRSLSDNRQIEDKSPIKYEVIKDASEDKKTISDLSLMSVKTFNVGHLIEMTVSVEIYQDELYSNLARLVRNVYNAEREYDKSIVLTIQSEKIDYQSYTIYINNKNIVHPLYKKYYNKTKSIQLSGLTILKAVELRDLGNVIKFVDFVAEVDNNTVHLFEINTFSTKKLDIDDSVENEQFIFKLVHDTNV
jgi:hypothetical protein